MPSLSRNVVVALRVDFNVWSPGLFGVPIGRQLSFVSGKQFGQALDLGLNFKKILHDKKVSSFVGPIKERLARTFSSGRRSALTCLVDTMTGWPLELRWVSKPQFFMRLLKRVVGHGGN